MFRARNTPEMSSVVSLGLITIAIVASCGCRCPSGTASPLTRWTRCPACGPLAGLTPPCWSRAPRTRSRPGSHHRRSPRRRRLRLLWRGGGMNVWSKHRSLFGTTAALTLFVAWSLIPATTTVAATSAPEPEALGGGLVLLQSPNEGLVALHRPVEAILPGLRIAGVPRSSEPMGEMPMRSSASRRDRGAPEAHVRSSFVAGF